VITYLDSSIVLDRIVDAPGAAELWRTIETSVTSILTETECLRTLDRFRLAGRMNEAALVRGRESLFRILESTEIIALGRGVLDRASLPMPVPVKTLDAIHLASAMVYRETTGPLYVATNDRALARAARAMGFEVLGAA
jgi:predicted nucleic acid-binding protein